MPARAPLRVAAVSLLLVASVWLVFGQVQSHAFVDFDDFLYIRDNPWLRDPLDWSWIERALSHPYQAYWIPLTWLSYRLDFAMYGPDAGGFLRTNVALHAANSLLLFLALRRLTGSLSRSAFVAGVFAVHPLHVESVAWASERKDVLSTLFWMLGTWLYALRWKDAPGRSARVACELGVAVCMMLGLLAKPMLVTFPLALVLLDLWPLERLRAAPGGRWPIDPAALGRVVVEKLPLFAIALGASVIVLATQQQAGGRQFAEQLTFAARVQNALESYLAYLGASVWPAELAAFYPLSLHPGPLAGAVLSACVLVLAGAAGVAQLRERPWLAAGFGWFVLNLAPVIGLVGVGMQARADRWMYVPLIGLAWIVAWGAADLVDRVRSERRRLASGLAAVLGVGALIALAAVARTQVATWRDTQTLFEHALRVTEHNWYANHRLAVMHRQAGRLQDAERHYLASLVDMPRHAWAQGELADVLQAQGKTVLASGLYANVPQTSWRDDDAGLRLASVLLTAGRIAPALELLDREAARGRLEEVRAAALDGLFEAERADRADAALALRDAVLRFEALASEEHGEQE